MGVRELLEALSYGNSYFLLLPMSCEEPSPLARRGYVHVHGLNDGCCYPCLPWCSNCSIQPVFIDVILKKKIIKKIKGGVFK